MSSLRESVYIPYADIVQVSPRPADVAAVMPVTQSDLKAQARVDTDEEDDLLAIYRAAAIDGIERETGHYMGQVALDAYLDWWPIYGSVYLPGGNVQRVVEIMYRDEDGVEQPWGEDNWELQRFSRISSVRRARDGDVVPRIGYFGGADGGYSEYREDRHAVRIRYVAGYATVDEIPVGLRQATLMLGAVFYIEREAHRTQPGVIAVDNPGRAHADQRAQGAVAGVNAPFAGLLRTRIVIDRPMHSQDRSGERVVTWEKAFCVWARVRAEPGREEGVVGGALLATAYFNIEMRYRTDISADMSVALPDGRRLDILSEPVDPDGTRERTVIRCEYRGGAA